MGLIQGQLKMRVLREFNGIQVDLRWDKILIQKQENLLFLTLDLATTWTYQKRYLISGVSYGKTSMATNTSASKTTSTKKLPSN